MTTSKMYFDVSLLKHSIIQDRNLSIYCFLKDKIIGKSGFCFHKNTFISHRFNIHSFDNNTLSSFDIEYKDCLTKKELLGLVYSFYKYNGTQRKYKSLFEKILSDLTE